MRLIPLPPGGWLHRGAHCCTCSPQPSCLCLWQVFAGFTLFRVLDRIVRKVGIEGFGEYSPGNPDHEERRTEGKELIRKGAWSQPPACISLHAHPAQHRLGARVCVFHRLTRLSRLCQLLVRPQLKIVRSGKQAAAATCPLPTVRSWHVRGRWLSPSGSRCVVSARVRHDDCVVGR